jgi:hypothetical protein
LACLLHLNARAVLQLSFNVIGAGWEKGAVFGVFNGIKHLRQTKKKPRRMLIYKGK